MRSSKSYRGAGLEMADAGVDAQPEVHADLPPPKRLLVSGYRAKPILEYVSLVYPIVNQFGQWEQRREPKWWRIKKDLIKDQARNRTKRTAAGGRRPGWGRKSIFIDRAKQTGSVH